MDKTKITQVVNAGILIDGMGKKILIDGIHNVKTDEWSTVEDELMNYIIYGRDKFNKFKDINYLLFSHQHIDHFSMEKTLEYIENNKVDNIITTKLNDITIKRDDLLLELNSDYYRAGMINLNNFNLIYIKTKHLSHEKFGIDHYVFIINIDNKNILFLGDSDYTKTELIEALKNMDVEIIVAPFIIVSSTPGRNFIKEVDPNLLIINHLPFTKDDTFNYRNMAEKNVKKYFHDLPKTVIFQNLYDEIIID